MFLSFKTSHNAFGFRKHTRCQVLGYARNHIVHYYFHYIQYVGKLFDKNWKNKNQRVWKKKEEDIFSMKSGVYVFGCGENKI